MPHTELQLEYFFQAYERSSNSGDFSALVAQFADVFFAAGPDGGQAVRASDFALALPRRNQLFDSLGCGFASLVALAPVALDARHTLVRTQWRMNIEQAPAKCREITFDSTFIVDTSGDTMRIIFYLAHQDLLALVKGHACGPGSA